MNECEGIITERWLKRTRQLPESQLAAVTRSLNLASLPTSILESNIYRPRDSCDSAGYDCAALVIYGSKTYTRN